MPEFAWHGGCTFSGTMVARRYQDLIAWQLADQLEREVQGLVKASPEAQNDWRFKSQLLESSRSVPANIAEGFLRFSPGDFRRFLDYSLGSLAEMETRLHSGVQLGYFASNSCEAAFRLGRRCLTAMVRLKHSQRNPSGRRP